jgi:hypothetical protein
MLLDRQLVIEDVKLLTESDTLPNAIEVIVKRAAVNVSVAFIWLVKASQEVNCCGLSCPVVP